MNYLELVNLVIQESGNELNELDSTTFSSAAAGQRLYPRLKRYVAQAWKTIQMARDDWEFMSGVVHENIYPRIRFSAGSASPSPSVGDVFVGAVSGFSVTVRQVILDSGTFATDDAAGQVEFATFSGSGTLIAGETFTGVTDPTAFFTYDMPGDYDFSLTTDDLAGIQWTTFTGANDASTEIPVPYIPWTNWYFAQVGYNAGSANVPQYVSQNSAGKVVFYPQIQSVFRVSFEYTKTPQTLTAYTDTPTDLPLQYHEWIAWEALMRLATYDKNSQLFAHAQKQAVFFRNRAEKNLMPLMTYRGNPFNE
jgi:hypothetical protein